jgi:hypothetical protein
MPSLIYCALHVQGVLVWHSSKCSTVLSLLLANQQQQQQQQQHSAPPLQQHLRAQCSRRSEAWEDWAEWELEQQQQQQQQQAQHAGAGAAGHEHGYNGGCNNDGWLMGLLQAVVGAAGYGLQQQLASSRGASSSSAAAAAGAPAEPAPDVGLVFCYANDLSRYSHQGWTGFG